MEKTFVYILILTLFIPSAFSQTRIGGNVGQEVTLDEEFHVYFKKETKFITDVQDVMNDCKNTSGITFKGLEELQMRLSVEIMNISSYQEDCGGNSILADSKVFKCLKKDKQVRKSLKELIQSPDQFVAYSKRRYLTDGKRAGDLLLFLQNLETSVGKDE